ncbi:MAG: ankyrin repeat domain-containing protein [Candidatus Dependentiae bacterium]|nr:ankyrin repeat domain-containing protein [Candidatus Dependentiae bacterium]
MKVRFFLFFLTMYCVFGAHSSVLAAKKKKKAGGLGPDVPVTLIDDAENSPLLLAVARGDVFRIQSLMQKGHAVNQPGTEGMTALIMAAQLGHLEAAKVLLAAKANVNQARNGNYAPLHSAAQNGHTIMVNLLLQEGAQVDVQRENGATPLHLAVNAGYGSTVKALLKAKAHVDSVSKDGCSSLHFALKKGSKDVFDSLIQAKADIDMKTGEGYTPLFIAMQEGHFSLANKLLDGGADLEAMSGTGLTPFGALVRVHGLHACGLHLLRLNPLPRGDDVGLDDAEPTIDAMIAFLRTKIKLDKARVCLGCGLGEREGAPLRVCAKCKDVLYCSRECQVLDWKIQHKYDCGQALEDAGLEQPTHHVETPFSFLTAEDSRGGVLVDNKHREQAPVKKKQEQSRLALEQQQRRQTLVQDNIKEQEILRAQQEESEFRERLELNRVAIMRSKQLRAVMEKSDGTQRDKEREVRNLFNQGFRLFGEDDTRKRKQQLESLLGHVSDTEVKKSKPEKRAEARNSVPVVAKLHKSRDGKGAGKSRQTVFCDSSGHKQETAMWPDRPSAGKSSGDLGPAAPDMTRAERLEWNKLVMGRNPQDKLSGLVAPVGTAEVGELAQEQKNGERHGLERSDKDYDVVFEHSVLGSLFLDANHVFRGEERCGGGLHLDCDGALESQGVLVRVPSALEKSGNGCYRAKRAASSVEDSPARSLFPSNWSREILIQRLGMALPSKHTVVYVDRWGDTCILGFMPKIAGDRDGQALEEIYFKAIIKRDCPGVIRTVHPIKRETYAIKRETYEKHADSQGQSASAQAAVFEQAQRDSLLDYQEQVYQLENQAKQESLFEAAAKRKEHK